MLFVFQKELSVVTQLVSKAVEDAQRKKAEHFACWDPKLGALLLRIADATRDVREYLLTKLEDGRPGTVAPPTPAPVNPPFPDPRPGCWLRPGHDGFHRNGNGVILG